MLFRMHVPLFSILTVCLLAVCIGSAETDPMLPDFGQDTVLVWESGTQGGTSTFVVRLASFYPDRLMEWEDRISQGSLLISNRDLLEADGYVNNKLFKQGMDIRSDDETTLWLSRKTFKALKEKKEAKCTIDRVAGKMTYEREDFFSVEVNGSPILLPIIIVRDDRGSEKWFLDNEDNPILIKYILRQYKKTLISITTNRKNTLRWLRGQKLQRLLTQ